MKKCIQCGDLQERNMCLPCIERHDSHTAFVKKMNCIANASMILNKAFRYPHVSVADEHLTILVGPQPETPRLNIIEMIERHDRQKAIEAAMLAQADAMRAQIHQRGTGL